MPALNSKATWDSIWKKEGGIDSWRTYGGIFDRIVWLLKEATAEAQPGTSPIICDFGGGAGILLNKIKQEVGPGLSQPQYVCIDHSTEALNSAASVGLDTVAADLNCVEDDSPFQLKGDVFLCTEVLEHLPLPSVERLLAHSAANFSKGFIMVPNYCMGPEAEPQHLRAWSAIDFLNLLRSYHPSARVEVFHDPEMFRKTGKRGWLLGIFGYSKPAKLSFTMPVKNEGHDIERVLASFRGSSDEIVIGIDDTSSDETEQIVRLYADKVFFFTWEKSFSKARNACIERCTGDWIFMSEGHESLHNGHTVLLQLDEVESWINVIDVKRESQGCSWYFPWLFRNKRDKEGNPIIKFERDVHNVLVGFDENECVEATQISTWHERHVDQAKARSGQRKGMNKQTLLDDLIKDRRRNARNMYYLGVEYLDQVCAVCKGARTVPENSESCDDSAVFTETTHGWEVKTGGKRKACPSCRYSTPEGAEISTGLNAFALRQSLKWFNAFIVETAPSTMRYQARLSLSGLYLKMGSLKQARRILIEATVDDPTRVEHWLRLGEIHEALGELPLALRFYEWSACAIGRPPHSNMFLDKAMYTYLPAQKLVSVYFNLGLLEEALYWAEKVPDLLPDWADPASVTDAQEKIDLCRAALESSNEGQLAVTNRKTTED